MIDQDLTRISVASIVRNSIAIPWRKRAIMLRALLPASLILIAINMAEPIIQAKLGLIPALFASVLYLSAVILFAVTCHRLILLNEGSVPKYGLTRWSKRETRFAGWTFLGYFCFAFITGLVTFFSVGLTGSPQWLWATCGPYALYFVAIPGAYVVARCSILLPATAVDERRDLTWAWEVTEGNGWRLVLLIAVLPLGLWTIPRHLLGPSAIVDLLIYVVGCALSVIEIAALSLSYRQLTGP